MSWIGWPIAALVMAVATPAGAWRNQGHMATGLIAYDRLSGTAPDVIAAVNALMLHHPDHARFDAALAGLTGDGRTRRLFALMARWPDDIRGTSADHPHWHHRLRVVAGWTLFGGIRVGAADQAFNRNLKIMQRADADPARRAVALCWLLHIVGDMHQPLHAGHLMDGRFPITDKAGTIGWVRRAPGAAPETFHHFWDDIVSRPRDGMAGDDVAGAETLARAVPAPQPVDEPAGLKARYRLWVRESERLAATFAYAGAGRGESPWRDRAPVLPPDYVMGARALSEQRVAQAGGRMADMIVSLFAAD